MVEAVLPKPRTARAPINDRPEHKLLLHSARTVMDSENGRCLRELAQGQVDWVYLMETASKHGVLPLLRRSLEAICPEAVPKGTLRRLRVDCLGIARHNRRMTHELCEVLRILESHDIPAVPFKGPVLASSAYGDIGLRQFADLDILIHESNVFRARDLLLGEGWEPESQVHSQRDAEYFLRCGHQFVLTRDSRKVVVELQWRITPAYFSFDLSLAQLWERVEQVALGDMLVHQLRAEDLLLVLCVHGAKHCWERLEWVCDVSELIRSHPEMNWQVVYEQAQILGVERMVLLGLGLAHHLTGAVLPEQSMLKVQGDVVVSSLTTQVQGSLFSPGNASDGVFTRFRFHLAARERWQDKVRYAVKLAITPTLREYTFLPLPKFLSFVYYPLRPILLVSNYVLKSLIR